MGALATNILDKLDLAKLVEELAANLRPAEDVWNSHGIYSRTEAEKLLSLPMVQEMYTEARTRWHSKLNVRERIKSKSLMAIEDGLADMVVDATDGTKPLNHRTEVWKLIGKFAGIDAESAGPGAIGPGINITIDLSGGPVVEGQPPVITISGSDPDVDEVGDDEDDGEQDEDGVHKDFVAEAADIFKLDIDEEIDMLGAGLDAVGSADE